MSSIPRSSMTDAFATDELEVDFRVELAVESSETLASRFYIQKHIWS
jgi:hypothetical protein